MGWFGNYEDSQAVADEIIESKYNDKIGYVQLLDSKITKTKGALLLSSKNIDYKFIYFYIFEDGMYKGGFPCDMYSAENFVPQSWYKQVIPYFDENALLSYNDMKQRIKKERDEQKEKKTELKHYFNILLADKNNRYNAKDYGLYNIKYAFFDKGYIFVSHGQYVRLKNMDKNTLELI